MWKILFATLLLAAPPSLPGKLSQGIGSLPYYVDPSASFAAVPTAAADWTHSGHGNPIKLSRTIDSQQATINAYGGSLAADTYAWTECYDSSGEPVATGGQAPTQDYDWVKITFNNNFMSSPVEKNGTIARHELGHALGLGHITVSDLKSIMKPIFGSNDKLSVDKAAAQKVREIYGKK